ncbi:MAG: glycosyltransferase [Ignavibacteriales bacterium]|nr:glycosyltransferase [Ignavibacteriales bacterium]
MIEKRDILIFADDWGRYPSTMQHIGKILAEHNRILWVGSLGLRKPKFSIADIKRVFEKLTYMFLHNTAGEIQEVPVLLFSPFVFPFHDSVLFGAINKFLLRRQISKKISALDFTDTLVFTSSPVVAAIIGSIRESSSYYFCLDDYKLFKDSFTSLPKYEELLMRKVQASFSVSEILMKTRVPASGRTYFLPQGVNFQHFNKAVAQKATNKKPVFGFFGLLAEWVNVALITKMAEVYPEYEFVIIGKAVVDVTSFSGRKNITYLGEIPYEKLPQYAATFDVGLIPFYLNNLTIAVNPIKLIEYFALGIPVVSIAMPEVKKFEGLAFSAEDEKTFIDLLPKALAENNPQKNTERESIARSHSWNSIVENISAIVIESEKKQQR